MSYMIESCPMYEGVMSTHESVMSHMWTTWVAPCNSHIWMSHVTHENESCHTYEWVMSHMLMSHVTHMNESRHIWTSHVTCMRESCLHMNESCLIREPCKSHIVNPIPIRTGADTDADADTDTETDTHTSMGFGLTCYLWLTWFTKSVTHSKSLWYQLMCVCLFLCLCLRHVTCMK